MKPVRNVLKTATTRPVVLCTRMFFHLRHKDTGNSAWREVWVPVLLQCAADTFAWTYIGLLSAAAAAATSRVELRIRCVAVVDWFAIRLAMICRLIYWTVIMTPFDSIPRLWSYLAAEIIFDCVSITNSRRFPVAILCVELEVAWYYSCQTRGQYWDRVTLMYGRKDYVVFY